MHVAALNSAGQSAWSPAIQASGLYPPSPVQVDSVDARYRESEIRFSSNQMPVSSTTFVASPGNHTCVAPPFSSLCILSGLTGGARYTATATSVNPAGTSTPTTLSLVSVGAPTSVGQLKAKPLTSHGTTNITLNWSTPGSLRYGQLAGVAYEVLHDGPGEHLIHPWRTNLT